LTQNPSVELNTAIPNLKTLQASDLAAYDAIYLGASFCLKYEGNSLTHEDDLRQAVGALRQQGKRVFLSTYAIPLTTQLDAVRANVACGVEAGVDGVEIHNMGVARMIAREFPGLPLVAGSFANVYTNMTADVLQQHGVRRVVPNHELPLDEINVLQQSNDLEIELLVHGKIPLGVSESCFLLSYQETTGIHCPNLCQQDFRLRREDWEMISLGKAVVSGKDMCMIEHLPALLAAGYHVFRLEGLSESAEYRATVAQVYREAVDVAIGAPDGFDDQLPDFVRRLDRVSTGFCNGYYFGLPGRFYRDGNAVDSPAAA